MKITVDIEHNEDLPKEQQYTASVLEGEYRGFVVSAPSVAACFWELSVIFSVSKDYINLRQLSPSPVLP